jgi:hypothetical protein
MHIPSTDHYFPISCSFPLLNSQQISIQKRADINWRVKKKVRISMVKSLGFCVILCRQKERRFVRRDMIPVGTTDFVFYTPVRAVPSLTVCCTTGSRVQLRGQRGRGVVLTTHLQLSWRLTMSGPTPLLPSAPAWHVTGRYLDVK